MAVLERIEPGDAVVFIGNSTTTALRGGVLTEPVAALAVVASVQVLADDLSIRGIDPDSLVPGIETIDYAGLVALTLKHDSVHSWC